MRPRKPILIVHQSEKEASILRYSLETGSLKYRVYVADSNVKACEICRVTAIEAVLVYHGGEHLAWLLRGVRPGIQLIGFGVDTIKWVDALIPFALRCNIMELQHVLGAVLVKKRGPKRGPRTKTFAEHIAGHLPGLGGEVAWAEGAEPRRKAVSA